MDGTWRSHRAGGASTDPETTTLRRPARPPHARNGWLRSRRSATRRNRYEIRPRGHPDIQIDDPAGQGATPRTSHICGAQSRIRSIRPGRTSSLGQRESRALSFGGEMAHVILVVEDNERNLKLLRDVLEYLGYEVRSARTAEEGITSALKERPNLILMDLQ